MNRIIRIWTDTIQVKYLLLKPKFQKMNSNFKYCYGLAAVLMIIFSCNTVQDKPKEVADTTVAPQAIPMPVKETVITAEQQKALTPG